MSIQKMQPRLLIVANVGWFFMSHRLPLALAAKARGFDVHVAAGLDPELDVDTRETLAANGIALHKLAFSRNGSGLIELLRNLIELIGLYIRIKPDVVHLVAIKPVLLGGIAARLLRVSSVVLAVPGRGAVFTATGRFARARQGLASWAYRFAYQRGRNVVIVQNVEDRDFFVSRGLFADSDVHLIRGSGADMGIFNVTPETMETPVVLLASRMLRQKGISDFVMAASILFNKGVRARFVLVGTPDAGNSDSHTVDELNTYARSPNVEWWKRRNDMSEVFRRSHIVCLPTFYCEGVPKVLIEAAACGRAIVTTDTPGCRDIVRNGLNGLLVPPRDPEALASAIEQLLADDDLRKSMGAKGRALAEREFDVRLVTEKTLDIYHMLLRPKQLPSRGT